MGVIGPVDRFPPLDRARAGIAETKRRARRRPLAERRGLGTQFLEIAVRHVERLKAAVGKADADAGLAAFVAFRLPLALAECHQILVLDGHPETCVRRSRLRP